MSIFEWLKLLESLTSQDKKNLEVFCQEKFLKSWDIVFREWDDANAMYFLTKWSVSIYKESIWDRINLWVVNAEEILWEMALFWWWWKRMATAEVIEDVRLITILSFSIQDITEKHPELMIKIKNVIEERSINNKTLENTIENTYWNM